MAVTELRVAEGSSIRGAMIGGFWQGFLSVSIGLVSAVMTSSI